MTHRAHSSPDLRDRLIAAWGGRATIRRNLAIAVSDTLALTLALQAALHVAGVNLSVGWTGAFSTASRVLTGLGIWLVSRAWLRFTGEISHDEEGHTSA